MEFDPPIASRETVELVGIAHFPEDWDPEAVEQAKAELVARNVTESEQEKIAKQLQKEVNQLNSRLAKERSEESYSRLDMFFMFLYIPRTLLWDWFLKKEGYHTKHKQRLYVIGFTILFWTITLTIFSFQADRNAQLWQNQVNNQDIYEWEKDNYSDEEIVEFRKESIEQLIETVLANERGGTPTYVILDQDTIPNSKVEQLRNLDMLNIRDVVFEGDFEPEPHEWITIKLVKPADNRR